MCELTMLFYNGWERRCRRRAASLGKATVCGNLYLLPPDCPVLQVPNDSIVLAGIKDAFEAAQEQDQENDHGDFKYKILDGWNTVHGELVAFHDPERDVPELDKQYGAPFYFDRMLVPARKADGSIIAAWVYVMDNIHFSARRLPDGIWPEKTGVKS